MLLQVHKLKKLDLIKIVKIKKILLIMEMISFLHLDGKIQKKVAAHIPNNSDSIFLQFSYQRSYLLTWSEISRSLVYMSDKTGA